MKTKKLIALFVAVVMMFAMFATFAACNPDTGETYECQNACPNGDGCLTEDCEHEACETKCPTGGVHGSTPYECTNPCPNGDGCLTVGCTHEACETKCPTGGVHGGDTPYTCQNPCPYGDGCLTEDCEHEACETKCPTGGVHQPGDEVVITFEVGSHGTLDGEGTAQTVDNKLASLPNVTPHSDRCTFLGWFTEETDGEQVTTSTVFTVATTIYAQYKHEFLITLNVNNELGTLAAGAETSFVTVDGKISGALPAVTAKVANYDFFGWTTQDNGAGKEVIENETVFTADSEIYAFVGRKTGVWVNGTGYNALIKNTGASGSGLVAEYWFGGGKKTFAKDDVLTVYMNGKQVSFFVDGSSSGIEYASTDVATTSVKVKTPGEFAIYLKDYSSSSKPNNWVCEFSGPTEINTGSEVPEGCDKFEVQIGSSIVIYFYLVDSTGTAVGQDRFDNFCIYTYNGEIFGNWAGSQTKGVIQEVMTATGSSIPEGWIFRWGKSSYSNQTANIINAFANGKTYLVELPSSNKGEAKVTELQLGAE